MSEEPKYFDKEKIFAELALWEKDHISVTSDDQLLKFILGEDSAERDRDKSFQEQLSNKLFGFRLLPMEERVSLALNIKEKAKELAITTSTLHGLTEQDSIALEIIYTHLAQTDLIRADMPTEVRLLTAQQTGIGASQTKSGNLSIETVKISPTLTEIILTEFSRVALLEPGVQVRRSKKTLFNLTAIHALSLIPSQLGEKSISPFNYKVQIATAVPVDRITTSIGDFSRFRHQVTRDIQK